MLMRIFIFYFFVLFCLSNASHAEMVINLKGPWDGKKVPAGEQCILHGGKGKTPPMEVSKLPNGTSWVHVEYNDQDYQPLSFNGGHGIIGYPVSGSKVDLYSVNGMEAKLTGKAKVVKKARSTGKYASKGYLPPCSGGWNNQYFAVIKAINSNGQVLEKKKVWIGRY
jgi:hypothetical protein